MKKAWFALVVALTAALSVGCARADNDSQAAALCQADAQSACSADGTRIGFAKIGTGPSQFVIVPGALDIAESWAPAATAMGGQCTCYVMDRRGRGRSGDSTNYSLEREIEDIKAVLNAAGPGSFLLGHSSGAIYALEAASRFPVAGLVLYEPPLHYQVQFAKVFDHMRVEAQSHRYDEALAVFMREEAGLPEDQIAAARSSPDWQGWAALMPTMVREWNEIIRFAPSVDQYRNLSVPTLLLTGSETEHHPSFATRALQGAMPDARTSVLEGQGHEGNSTAPDLVAREVSKFLSAAHQ